MLIHEVSRRTGLTRKAIEYYAAQGLIAPAVLENGYRDFSESEVETLQNIHTLRQLDLSVEQIRAILTDGNANALQTASIRAALNAQRAQIQHALLDRLATGASFEAIRAELDALENRRTITDRLMDAFPGYFGRFLALHFAPYLDMPIATAEQQAAYREVIAFLDDAPPLPDEICAWIDEATACLPISQMTAADHALRDMVNDPEQFMAKYEEALAYAEAFRASEIGQRMQTVKQLFSQNGYYDVFIPALRRLSPAYDEYSRKLAALDTILTR